MIYYDSTEARKHLSEIINRVKYERIIIAIGRNDKDEVLIIPKPDVEQELSISSINASSPSFSFLKHEPDLYSMKDLKKLYV